MHGALPSEDRPFNDIVINPAVVSADTNALIG